MSVHSLNYALTDNHDLSIKQKIDLVFHSLSGILGHSANMTKVIWGSQDRKANRDFRNARKQNIQQILNINEDSPISTVVMRNNLEHFDERLDEWSSDPNTLGSMVDINLGHKDAVSIGGAGTKVFLRNFDPNTNMMTFFDDEINIQDLVIEVFRIRDLASSEFKRITLSDA